ncbi:YiiX/YebB-like N1pC/P60 family cysteine hydrolase (plasmid) [Halobacillus sp. ACCC02827]|uniref:YiiX/YebB-like N1pC/P60 family cysteine hydrolase n=1 Tax=Halobacillus sp. ACCC02827 TaxID=3052090 RepID=UPI002570B7B1|nr:YiiX/YebB-like N1pC/P60 family cysteine hydrolase [Halobacillus sp. ACCC02827]WJE14012.1 YiiX/YebB-like N1pC/P60 family cysteine hydrolase [Halobacillus sp. ACCC02827]
MKNFFSKTAIGLMFLLFVGVLFGLNTVSAEESENIESDGYSNEEILNMTVEQLEELGLKNILEENQKQEDNDIVSAAAFSHKGGDILVTKNTQCKSSSKCTGITGHSGIVLNNGKVLHIQGPGYKANIISTSTWYSRYKSTKVVRPKSSTEGKKAATWAYNFYVKGAGKNYSYDVRTTLNGSGKTYCSKLVWQAYKNGAGKNLGGYTPGLRTPYDFLNYTWWNGHKVVRTVGW